LNETSRCPVCLARFRGSRQCSRCGADLGRLMLLEAEAWRLREAARRAIAARDFQRGLDLAARAQETHRTPSGEALVRLVGWMGERAAGEI
jgi:predicted amidophosphoribosyltransferase